MDSRIRNHTEGPKAPQDPMEQRSYCYVLLDSKIAAADRPRGKPSEEIYLEGQQLKNKARLIGGVANEEIIALLGDCSGFHKLVHSIGVSVTANDNLGPVYFVLQNWGKKSKYETGTLLRLPCPTDGTEVVFELKDYEWSSDDDVPGKFGFEFQQVGLTATASIRLYLRDGYVVPELTTEAPVEFESQAYKTMISKSLLSMGNNYRLRNAIEKAERGEDVTIAYIGGSITQGAGAKPIHTDCYAYKSYLQFKEMFGVPGRDNVHFIKAGVGGTPSELGIVRYERDVLRDGAVDPDIVIIEFAVNDAGDETQGKCFESLCLNALSADNRPAVILLFSVFVNDWNLQDRLAPVGSHYGLGMVSVKDAVVHQFRLPKDQGNVISKRQFFYDIYHPTNDGHTVMADCLAYLFAEAKKAAKDKEDIRLDKEPRIGNEFVGIRLLDRKDRTDVAKIECGSFDETDSELQMVEMDDQPFGTPEFPYNWMRTASSGQESFKMTITSRNLILVYKDSGRTDFGKADIFVDGGYVRSADPHENNWTHCNAIILYQDDIAKEHQIEIRMAAGNEDKCFTILGFGFVLKLNR